MKNPAAKTAPKPNPTPVAPAAPATRAFVTAAEAETAQVAPQSDSGGIVVVGSNLSAEQTAFFKNIADLGRDQGKGISSLLSLAEMICKAGASGTITVKQVKEAYKVFREASNTAAGKNAEADGHTITANASKLRTFYKLGEEFPDEGARMLNLARDVHVDILRNKDERKYLSKALTPTYEALVVVARRQIEKEDSGAKDANGKTIYDMVNPDIFTKDQIREVFIPDDAETQEATVEDVILAALKAVERIQKGKHDENGTEIRPAFTDTGANSVGEALHGAHEWLLQAGERVRAGFQADRQQAIDEAAAKAEARRANADAKREKEAEEKAARDAEKARLAAEKAAKAAPVAA